MQQFCPLCTNPYETCCNVIQDFLHILHEDSVSLRSLFNHLLNSCYFIFLTLNIQTEEYWGTYTTAGFKNPPCAQCKLLHRWINPLQTQQTMQRTCPWCPQCFQPHSQMQLWIMDTVPSVLCIIVLEVYLDQSICADLLIWVGCPVALIVY